MSSDSYRPDPGDTPLPQRLPEPPVAPDEEPLLVEQVQEEAFTAELAEPHDKLPPPRRPERRPRPPAPPHPGFWWALFWSLVMLIVTQGLFPLGVLLLLTIIRMVQLGSINDGMQWLLDSTTEMTPTFLLGLLATAHLSLIVFAVLALRIVAGANWPRQVALRLPSVKHTLLALAAVPGFWLLSNGIALVVSLWTPGITEMPSYAVTLILVVAVISALWLAVRVTSGQDWVPALARAPLSTQLAVGPVYALTGIALGCGVFFLVSPHVFSLPEKLGEETMGKMVEAFQQAPWWAAMLVVGGCPALSEELFCRAFLGRGLVGRHGPVMGVILTSLFFGAIHGIPHQAMMAVFAGIALHYLYLTSRSLFIPMLVHFLNNSLAVIGDKLPDPLGPKFANVETHPEGIPWVWFLVSAFLVAAVVWAFYTSRGRLVRTDGSDLPPWQPPFPGVAHPPPGSGTEVVYPWPGVLPTLAVIAAVVAFGCTLFWT
jgi:membrane protease YdiL (CAAX protease family)